MGAHHVPSLVPAPQPPSPSVRSNTSVPRRCRAERRMRTPAGQPYEDCAGGWDAHAVEGRGRGVQVETQILSGSAAEVLAEAAKADDVELVTVGSRGRTLVGSILLGGTSHRLVHICKKPVLIVH